MSEKLEIIILAAGSGTRMYSSLPKVLHTLSGTPLIQHVLQAAQALDPRQVHVVINPRSGLIKEAFSNLENINWVVQEQQLGTGHAVQQALPHCDLQSRLLILYADVPLIKPTTLKALVSLSADITLLTIELENPAGYGRISRTSDGEVLAIVEEKDASEEEKKISETNTGILCGNVGVIGPLIGKLSSDNAQGEYYLTDVIGLAVQSGMSVEALAATNQMEVQGVNDQVQLNALERKHQREQAKALMQDGVRIMDPERFDLRGKLTAGKDVVIDINAVLEGEVTLGDGVVIGPNCCLKDARIGNGTLVQSNSIIEGAVVGSNCAVGPFARIRPGTKMADNVKVGNFVETKNASIGEGSKASHLSYLGDTDIGEAVNIGAGTITCNYDGENKHKTIIGDKVFVGSNTALVAPVEVEKNSHIGAGSTITKRIPENALAIARGRQKNIDNWKKKD
jgi:bifunctional UDP-N-acetylglucosamine pyrophosphorylase/glucosamine-1-phosphate N-acetyltransferase